ncbi:Cyclin-dependent kinase inhibitor 6 [Acorus gramineus]|uniref:Cyclin-dependent kinase inhibitor 6 n=1 Tax=Acorus gramineus TaxID=55184 RepID=A0AAV9AJ36_ACOGR|nr:Cyclin-dependent kinase inhibitor 6 [Acorus gramineus]
MDSTTRPSESNPRRRSSEARMPSEAEIEEFLSAAEKAETKRFAEKYNYDVVKDAPLDGRYEWIRLKQ